MSEAEGKRDKEIADLTIRTYVSQWDLRDKLDNKLNNFITIAGTVTTLSIGIALFVFERIPSSNYYYAALVGTFVIYLLFFVSALVIGLTGYKPTEYTWYPNDSVKLIEDYRRFPTERQVVRKEAGSYAKAANLNRQINSKKSQTCNTMYNLLILGVVILTLFSIFMMLALGVWNK
jgi:hypothetical protein